VPEVTPARARPRLRALLVDVSPLRYDRDFRWLWAGQTVGQIGHHITRIALPYQVYVLTNSTLAIAALTLFQLVPILLFSLGAGSLADAMDRRRLLVLTQVGEALATAALFVLALQPHPPLLGIFSGAFAAAALSAFDQPARSSALPRLVPPERYTAAVALSHLTFNAAAVVGPAIGGILLAVIGVAGVYLIDAISYSAAVVGALAIKPLPPLGTVARPGLAAIAEGLRYVLGRRLILSTFVIDLCAMVFARPIALYPVLALDVFRTGPAGVGLLAAAPAAGAFAAAVLSGWATRVRRTGLGVVVAVALWGGSMALFGLSTFSFALALALLAVAGAADLVSTVFRNTIVQLATPDELRGRVTSIHILVVSSGPRIGDIQAATVASAIGTQPTVVLGGLLCLLGTAAVFRAFPELARHVRSTGAGPVEAELTPAT
jgi:MFS family permease